MSGLSLNVGGWGGIGTAVPAAASQPGAPTVGTAAFGITMDSSGPRTAGYGAVLAGAGAAVLLVVLYCSLPR